MSRWFISSSFGATFDDELAALSGEGAAARAEVLLGAAEADADAELAALFKRSQESLSALRTDVERFRGDAAAAEGGGGGAAAKGDGGRGGEEEEEEDSEDEDTEEEMDDGYVPVSANPDARVHMDDAARRTWAAWEREMAADAGN